MASKSLLRRNIRPVQTRDDVDDELELEEDSEAIDELDEGTDEDAQSASDEDDASPDMDEDEDEDDEMNGEDADHNISNVSFGALKQAQDTLSKKRKRGSDSTPAHEDKLEAVRERLREIKRQKGLKPSNGNPSKVKSSAGAERQSNRDYDQNEDEEGSDSDSAPSEEGAPKSRSKHAPASQSTKHQVTRKRQVIEVPKRATRDPRFDAINQRSAHPGDSEKAYGFLRDYQKDEIAELKAAIRVTKDEDDREKLSRMKVSMENRLKAKEAKERQQEVLSRHRKEEKEKIQQGKNPYYLKKSELKEKALVEKFKGMKGKERERLMDRRRLKESQKEKKRMPEARRGFA